MIYVRVVVLATDLVWADDTVSTDLFSGTLTILAIMTGAGLLVGIIHHFLPRAGSPNVSKDWPTGRSILNRYRAAYSYRL